MGSCVLEASLSVIPLFTVYCTGGHAESCLLSELWFPHLWKVDNDVTGFFKRSDELMYIKHGTK